MNEYFIAWWNIENLFDVENSPTRSERLKKILKDELKGCRRGAGRIGAAIRWRCSG